jgi:predicted outer membrane repeat protein
LGILNLDKDVISGNTANYEGGGVFNNNIFIMATAKAEIKKNTAALGGGVANFGEFTMNSGTTSDNKAMIDNGGGIYNGATLFISGDSKIKSNTANLGGGIYSSGSLTFDGKKLSVTGNKAHEPPSVEEWYMGYGVYSESEPETSGDFNTKQVTTGNSKF